MFVGLEHHVIVYRGADQLCAFRGAEQHRAALDDEVHGEYLGSAVDAGDQPSE